MKDPRHESLLTRPAIDFALVIIIIGGISSFSCGGCTPHDSSRPSTQRDIRVDEQPFEIITYPAEGDVLRDLRRPIVVEFSNPVEREAVSFRLSPDANGWSKTWAFDSQRVVLDHANPLIPFQAYEFEVSVAPFAEVVTRFSTGGPSSLELIEQDETGGVIDLDTAWTYRMQYVFEADELPDEYRSTTPVRDVDSVFRDFLRVRSQLKPETLYRLRPYTVRPDHPDSVFSRYLERTDVAHSGAAAGGWVRAAYADEPGPEEGNADDIPRPARMVPEVCSPHIVVWSAPEEGVTAKRACGQIRTHKIYEDFEKLLGRRPIEDTDACQERGADIEEFEKCVEMKGGDERLDIYLVPTGYVVQNDPRWAGLCVPEELMYEQQATAFILIKPNDNLDEFGSTIAHEIFHAFQFAFTVYTDSWWMEATATWAEEFINDAWPTENDLPPAFSTTFHSQVKLSHTDGEHEYAIYLFPYYLEKVNPGSKQIIADIWEACENEETSLDAIDSVLGGEFDQTLKDFAVANFDLEPYEDKYQRPLPLFEHHGVWRLNLNHDDELGFIAKEAMDHLSARYQVWTNALDPNITPLVRFELDDFVGDDKLLLHAIIYANGDIKEEDWSDLEERVFCINREDDWFDQIALILVLADRPPEPDDQGAKNQQTPSKVRIEVSLETEACRPTMGTGEFKVEINNNWEDLVGRSSFTESVSGQVFFDEYHAGSAEYRGRARVHYKERTEKHVREEKTLGVDWVKDTYIEKDGRDEVECTLYYPWGQEGATYNLQCGTIEVRGKGREVITYPMRGESEERTWEFTETTDLDVTYISSYYGGLPARYDLNLKGPHLEEDISQGVNKSHYSSWNFFLHSPSPP